MARYADIDVLLEHLTTSDEGNFRTAITQWLEMHQVEDVAPVVHAHWCVTDAYPHNVYCSKCLIIFAQTHWPVWEDKSLPRTYCPSCGAKMDEVTE